MRSVPRILVLTACLATAAACQGPVFPQHVQQGGSFTVPVGSALQLDEDLVGYGGTDVADPQRGVLVYRLDDENGVVLPTRFTTRLLADPSSLAGIFGLVTAPYEIVSLVDVPQTAPEGTHDLHVTLERPGRDPLPVGYAGRVTILPHSIDVAGGAETAVGSPLSFAGALATGAPFVPFLPGDAQAIVPHPVVEVVLGSATGHAYELEVDYPAGVIDVIDVFEPPGLLLGTNHRALVWWNDDPQLGRLELGAISAGAHPIRKLAIAFRLDDPGTVLDPWALNVSFVVAADEDGAPLPGALVTWRIR